MKSPGRLEPFHIFAIDLSQLGITHATGVISHPWPIDRSHLLASSMGGKDQKTGGCEKGMSALSDFLEAVRMSKQTEGSTISSVTPGVMSAKSRLSSG